MPRRGVGLPPKLWLHDVEGQHRPPPRCLYQWSVILHTQGVTSQSDLDSREAAFRQTAGDVRCPKMKWPAEALSFDPPLIVHRVA